MEFNLKRFMEAKKAGTLDELIHSFLKGVGKNKKLSSVMKNKGFWIGPLKLSVKKLERCAGPEEHMPFRIDDDKWKKDIKKMKKNLAKGWEYPPLIIWISNGKLSISDGNHRFEALKLLGKRTCWGVVWCKNSKDEKMLDKIVNI